MQQFEQSAAQSHGTGIPNLADRVCPANVNHNVRTLGGYGTFHGMGMITAITPEISSERPVPRAKATAFDVSVIGLYSRTHGGPNQHMLYVGMYM